MKTLYFSSVPIGPHFFAFLTALCLASPAFSQQNATVATGHILKVDLKSRLADVAVESYLLPDGTLLGLGKPETKRISLLTTSKITYQDSPDLWLSLSELTAKTEVEFQVDRNSSLPWIVESLTLLTPDPTKIRLVSPPVPTELSLSPDKTCPTSVVVPMVFPVAGSVKYVDSFLASRDGGARRHRGQDLMAAKLTPLVACFDGVVRLQYNYGNAGNSITLVGDNGWTAQYYHVNNDTPGTDDGKGTALDAFAPGLANGDHVVAGQFIGYVGDSGNAENTGSHCHFELWSQEPYACFNAFPSLTSAVKITTPLTPQLLPDVQPAPKLVRLDGVVQSLDADKNELTLIVSSEQASSEPAKSVFKPVSRVVALPDVPRLARIGTTDVEGLDNLRAGDRLVLLVDPSNKTSKLVRGWVSGATQQPVASTPKQPNITAQKEPTPSRNSRTTTTPASRSGSTSTRQKSSQIAFVTGQDPLVRQTLDPKSQLVAQTFLTKINKARAAQKLSPVVLSTTLTNAAQAHTRAMAEGPFFDLFDPYRHASAADRATQDGYSGRIQGLVSSLPDLDALADNLLKYQADLLLDPKLKSIGLGTLPASKGKSPLWTILLGQ